MKNFEGLELAFAFVGAVVIGIALAFFLVVFTETLWKRFEIWCSKHR